MPVLARDLNCADAELWTRPESSGRDSEKANFKLERWTLALEAPDAGFGSAGRVQTVHFSEGVHSC
jgi:hypothetical protein